MKKVLSIMAAVVLLIAMLAACGGQPAATSESTSSETSATEENAAEEKSSDKKIIAYVLNSVDDWAQTYVNAGREKCEEYGFEALEMNPESDVQKQIDYVQSCISQNVDLIAIQPIDNAALAPMLKKANEAGIMVNSVYQIEEELGCDFVIYTVYGQYEAGQMAGKAMVEAIGEKGKVGIIAGNPGASNVVLRSEGFRSVVAEYPDITIVNEIACQWDRKQSYGSC
ncbi:MAG: sugar ABC transporter substrate-binding protein [Acetivibrionales bacterium]